MLPANGAAMREIDQIERRHGEQSLAILNQQLAQVKSLKEDNTSKARMISEQQFKIDDLIRLSERVSSPPPPPCHC